MFSRDQTQRFRRCVGDMAGDLALLDLFGVWKLKGVGSFIFRAALSNCFQLMVRSSRRGGCSRLEAAAAVAKTLQSLAEEDRWRLTAASCGVVLFAAVDEAVEEGLR